MKKVRSTYDRVRSVRDTIRNPRADFGHVPTAPEDPVAESIKRRVARWEAKYTPERVAAILRAKGEQMRERFRVQTEMLGRVEQRVAEVTDAAGVPVKMRIWYKSFGREMWALSRKEISGESLAKEAAVLIAKWKARGLTEAVQQGIRTDVFNVSAPIAP